MLPSISIERSTSGGITIDAPSPPAKSIAEQHGNILLPLEPRPGLALNTIVYGMLWALLLLAPGAIRRRIRRAKGRCPTCGFSLAGQAQPGCPECGSGRAPALPLAID
jgi:hypothetical protein